MIFGYVNEIGGISKFESKYDNILISIDNNTGYIKGIDENGNIIDIRTVNNINKCSSLYQLNSRSSNNDPPPPPPGVSSSSTSSIHTIIDNNNNTIGYSGTVKTIKESNNSFGYNFNKVLKDSGSISFTNTYNSAIGYYGTTEYDNCKLAFDNGFNKMVINSEQLLNQLQYGNYKYWDYNLDYCYVVFSNYPNNGDPIRQWAFVMVDEYDGIILPSDDEHFHLLSFYIRHPANEFGHYGFEGWKTWLAYAPGARVAEKVL